MQPRVITKFCLTVAVTIWAVLLSDVLLLSGLFLAEILLLCICSQFTTARKVIAPLLLFAGLLAALQLLCGASYQVAAVSALRMLTMTVIFVYLLATTASGEFHQLFTQTFRLPPEYSFMLTSVFRFIPDFIRESKQVREAQSCRGYREKGRGLGRLVAYGALIGPLVLRAISRSENMAMALALRGFASRTEVSRSSFHRIDYGFFSGMVIASAFVFAVR